MSTSFAPWGKGGSTHRVETDEGFLILPFGGRCLA